MGFFSLFLFTIANYCGIIINNWMKVVERMEMYYFTIAALIRWQRIRRLFQLTRYVQIAHLLKFAILLPFHALFFSVGSFIWVWNLFSNSKTKHEKLNIKWAIEIPKLEMDRGYLAKKADFIIKTNLPELVWCTVQLTVSFLGIPRYTAHFLSFSGYLALWLSGTLALCQNIRNLIGAWI